MKPLTLPQGNGGQVTIVPGLVVAVAGSPPALPQVYLTGGHSFAVNMPLEELRKALGWEE